MEKTTDTTEQYLDTLDSKHRDVMKELIDLIYKVAPEIEYTIWRGIFWGGSEQSILGFGEYDYLTSEGTSETWFIIGLARQKSYYSVYITAAKDGQYLAKKYEKELGKVKTGASSISFRKIEDINLEVLKMVFEEAIETADN